jgi:hypothetical protein
MSEHAPKDLRSQRLRLVLFRTLAGLLLLFGLIGSVALGVGAYLTATDPKTEGWFPPLLLGALALLVLLSIRVAYRALKIRSVSELEEQSKSRWLAFTDAPSPNTSLERTRDR